MSTPSRGSGVPAPVSPTQVMAAFDDELTEAEEAELARLMQEPALRAEVEAQLAGLAELQQLVRLYDEEATQAYPSVAQAVMARLEEAPRGASQEAPQEALSGGSSQGASGGELRRLPGPAESLHRPRAARGRERARVVGAGLFLAAAAALLVWAMQPTVPTAQPPAQASAVEPAHQVAAPPSASVAVVSAEEEPVAIVSVDFGSSDGTIFMLEETTPVVWLAEEPAAGQGSQGGSL